MNAMAIAVKQVSGLDRKPANFDRRAELDDVCIRVGEGDISGEKMESARLYPRNIANAAVGDASDTMERLTDGCMYFPDKCAESGPFIDILKYHDSRAWNGGDVPPPIHAIVIAPPSGHRLFGGANSGGGRIAHHGLHARKLAPRRAGHKAFVAWPDPEPLDGVGCGAGVERGQLLDVHGRESSLLGHLSAAVASAEPAIIRLYAFAGADAIPDGWYSYFSMRFPCGYRLQPVSAGRSPAFLCISSYGRTLSSSSWQFDLGTGS